jgi:hypothetical protein
MTLTDGALYDDYEQKCDECRGLRDRIKELENPQPCALCGRSLYKDNPACAVSHKEARK